MFYGCSKLIGGVADMCGNEVLKSVASPDGTVKAIVFQRDCGATTGFSTQVSVIANGETLPNDGGNIFDADCNNVAAPRGPGGGPAVAVQWTGPRELLLRYHPAARVFARKSQIAVPGWRFGNETITIGYAETTEL